MDLAIFIEIWLIWLFQELRTELRILFDIIHVQLIEPNSVGSLLL